MIKNKITGWSGKLKVALTTVIFIGANMFNSTSLLAQGSTTKNKGVANQALTLAQWENTYDREEINLKKAIQLGISNGRIFLQGKERTIDELFKVLKESPQWQNQKVLVKIDASTSMGLVDSIFFEFRRFNVRNFIFEGRAINGEEVSYLKMNLPARKNFKVAASWQNSVQANDPSYLHIHALVSKEIVIELDRPLLHYCDTNTNWGEYRCDLQPPLKDFINQVPGLKKTYPGIDLSSDIASDIVDFVDQYASGGRMDFIVMLVYSDKSTFQDFISECMLSRKGFLRVYDMRAQRQYGKPYTSLNKTESSIINASISPAIMFNTSYRDGARWTYDYKAK